MNNGATYLIFLHNIPIFFIPLFRFYKKTKQKVLILYNQ
jgi:hypothetical protein